MGILNDIATLTTARLIAANVAGGNVERGRIAPLVDAEVPLALVYTRRDAATSAGSDRVTQSEFFHTTTVAVSLFETADSATALEDALDAHAAAIQAALLNDSAFMAQFEGCAGMRTEIEAEASGERLVAHLTLEFDLLHGTIWLPTFVDDFETAQITSTQADGTPTPATIANPTTD